jgi:alpha-N-arabinofuranosidase
MHGFGRSVCLRALVALCVCATFHASHAIHAADATLKVSQKALHDGRINPMLFGNFIELLDDQCPGMWAEMLNDRGFEGVTPTAKWVYYDGTPTFCDRKWDENQDWTVEATGAFNGRCCARITGREDRAVGLTQSGLVVKRDGSYRFSAWLRSDVASLRVRAVLKTALPDGSFAELASAELAVRSSEWGRHVGQLEVEKKSELSERAVFELRVIGKGTLWADKLSLMPTESFTTPFPGYHIVRAYRGNFRGWRQDVVEVIKATHPVLIRWGGSVVDPGKYRWKNGIGERDQRVPFENLNWGRIDSNDVGIDEFCQFCALVDAKPLVCVSFSDGPQSAADLVEYCNGAASTKWGARRAPHGYPPPYGVKYWQLGNEISGDDDPYIKKCTEFIRVMKRVDPSIEILSSFPSQKVLDSLGKDLAYLAPHQYTRDLGACETDFRNLSSKIARTPGCGHLKLAVTEWNFTAGDWGLLRGKMLTLDGALLNARYLNLLCRHSNLVEIACRSNMTNSFCSGIIETNGSGVLKRPSYYVMQLYADHALPIPLAVAGVAPGLDVVACTDESRRQVSLFAINQSREPLNVAIDLSDFAGALAPLSIVIVGDTLDRRQPDVMNHWQAPDRVRAVTRKLTGQLPVTLPALSVSAISYGQR